MMTALCISLSVALWFWGLKVFVSGLMAMRRALVSTGMVMTGCAAISMFWSAWSLSLFWYAPLVTLMTAATLLVVAFGRRLLRATH